MAAFIEKTDWFGLLENTEMEDSVVCSESSDGKSAQVAEAIGEDGSVVASNVYGEAIAPSCTYQIKKSFNSAGCFKLGHISTKDGKSICLNSITFGTSAGAAPTLAASGEQVEDDASDTDACHYTIPTFTMPIKHHAAFLFNEATLGGTGCHITDVNYTASATISKAQKEGTTLSHDVSEGKIECSVSIIQTGANEPTLTLGENSSWVVTSPLTCSNPDADYPTWTATLTNYLSKDTANN